MSSSFEKQQKRQTIAGYKRSLNFCSTPVIGEAKKLSSISLSGIDSNSSSAREQNRRKILLESFARKQKRKRKLQTKKSKLKKKSKRAKRHDDEKTNTNIDTDWETCYEESRRQPLVRKASTSSDSGSGTPDALFRDWGSPEKVRRASQFVEKRLESPLLRPRAYEIESPERIDFDFKEDEDRTLPLKDLPPSCIYLDDSDSDNKSRHIKAEDAVKNYLGLRNKRNDQNHVRIEKCKEWLVNVSVPTTSSDYLWDEFVRNNHKNIGKYLASAGNAQKSPLKKRKSTSNENEEGEHFVIQSSPEEKFNFEKIEQAKLRKQMSIVRGHWDKSLQKWVRFYDTYDFPAAEDKFKRRMTLNQFLQKCRDKKSRLEEVESSSQNVNENVEESGKNLNSNTRGKRKRKQVDFQFESKEERSSRTMTDISDSELQRINRIRQFASRLNAKKKMMLETSKDIESHREISSLKRIKENNTSDDEEDETVVKPRSKPTIKSIEILTKRKWKIL
ncbi:hypothetical protein K0M31_019642 [Melipona bicolor]|uniref:Uncharacterized protein n=1 Tax=Melipona bicolor TaxID=60889 RepID=A0AA40G2U8_9HYME|nr:hypothetical protein K0M31_019642 [Melipona bicolor]